MHSISVFHEYVCVIFDLGSIGADFPGAVGANAPIGKGSVGACTQRKN